MSRVGEDGYNLVWNNCEHFAVAERKGSKGCGGWGVGGFLGIHLLVLLAVFSLEGVF